MVYKWDISGICQRDRIRDECIRESVRMTGMLTDDRTSNQVIRSYDERG